MIEIYGVTRPSSRRCTRRQTTRRRWESAVQQARQPRRHLGIDTGEPIGSGADGVLDSGFTLIELMVVLLILAILLAIAIPTFLGTTKTANDRAVQSNLIPP